MKDFFEWLNEVIEIGNSPIELERFDKYEFDADVARQECESEIYESSIDTSDFYSDIYSEPEDDPNFSGQSPENWLEENPKPEKYYYEDESEYQEAIEQWETDFEEAEENINLIQKNGKR